MFLVDKTYYASISTHFYNLIQPNSNNWDPSGSLLQFKRDEINGNADITTTNSSSFKYKSNLIDDVAADETVKDVQTVVPVKYLRSFWQSLEMPFINCKVNPELAWGRKVTLASASRTATTFKTTDAKLYFIIVTLSTKDNVKIVKKLSDGFKHLFGGINTRGFLSKKKRLTLTI